MALSSSNDRSRKNRVFPQAENCADPVVMAHDLPIIKMTVNADFKVTGANTNQVFEVEFLKRGFETE
jgi:hypothetical protein